MKKLPISIQTFEEIIKRDLIYVDKTNFIHSLVTEGKYYFLSRPRRFGKSLLLTTLKAFFQAKKELFKGLYIYDKEKDWEVYPIVHIDYSFVDYKTSLDIFNRSLLNHLSNIAEEYDLKLQTTILPDAFTELVIQLNRKYKQPVVILVDEYDKPLVDTLTKPNRFDENREILRNLYGAMKGLDGILRFVMLTGVSRFAKVSIFSGMNNPRDISMDDAFSTVVGFTQIELENYFEGYLEILAAKYSISIKAIMPTIQHWYNGFSFNGVNRLYNPFSILAFLTEKTFRNYWFSTGTPAFLMKLIKRQKQLPEIFEHLKVTDLTGSSMQIKNLPLVPLLYQTGYLTIESKGLDNFRPFYYLNYPNEEVRHSFLTYVTAAFLEKDEFEIQPEGLALRDALIEEDIPIFVLPPK